MAASSLWCTGPAYLYAGVGAAYAPVFVGTSDTPPGFDLVRGFEPVFTDVGGTRLPTDYLYQGQEAYIDLVLTKYVESAYQAMASVPQKVAGAGGINVDGDIGTLMVTEGGAFPVWVVFPYANKQVFSALGMPAGYRFFACLMEGPDRHRIGTGAKKIGVHLHAVRVFLTVGQTIVIPTVGYSAGSPPLGLTAVVTTTTVQLLYDFNMTGLPAVT